jgi:hypothetical protein
MGDTMDIVDILVAAIGIEGWFTYTGQYSKMPNDHVNPLLQNNLCTKCVKGFCSQYEQ